MDNIDKNFERLGDMPDKYPPSTLVLRGQFAFAMQDRHRELEQDYRKISAMYVAEMNKAAKLEKQLAAMRRKMWRAVSNWAMAEFRLQDLMDEGSPKWLAVAQDAKKKAGDV